MQPSIESVIEASVRSALAGRMAPIERDIEQVKGLCIGIERDRRRVKDDAIKALGGSKPKAIRARDVVVKIATAELIAATTGKTVETVIAKSFERDASYLAPIMRAKVDPAMTGVPA